MGQQLVSWFVAGHAHQGDLQAPPGERISSPAQDAHTFSKKLALTSGPARRAKTRTWPPSIRTAIVFMLPLKCEWPQQDGVPLGAIHRRFQPTYERNG